MLQKYLIRDYEATYRVGHSFRRQVVDYIETRQLEDGGYCFYRIPPSGGMDTYFAVKSLSLLGVKPKRPDAVADFFLQEIKEGSLGGVTGIFAAVEVLNELGRMTDELRNYAQPRIMALRNKAGGFGAVENIDVEVASELEETCRAVRVLKIVGADLGKQKTRSFVSSLFNPDGGYGARGHSTLASTFYTTEINKVLESQIDKLNNTRKYLRKSDDIWQASFDEGETTYLEDLFWLVKALTNLGEKVNFPSKVVRFVFECQTPPFYGFARARVGGIATLENTFYALSILREVGILLR